MKSTLKVIGIAAIFLLVIYAVVTGSAWLSIKTQFNRGESIVVLSETTTIVDDQVCQAVLNGNISYTGDGLNYFREKPGFLGFPQFEYHVILKNGDTLWVDQYHLKKFDTDETYCSPIVK